MSYQVLARKWRPQGFDEVSGQSHVTTPLRNAIRTDRLPHAVLLTGPRGVGKTTVARILARCLNCEKGPTDTPCGNCVQCTEITSGLSTDVQEIDAASRTGVDDVRELIEAVRYAPSPGKHKIFVVDEVHMLSPAAFNALLKTLEEPPPHTLFVFATTNPEKIPFTVVSRCQRYDLRRIAASEITDRLRTICESEGVEISDPSLLAIAREADGSLRDSLTLLDQLIAFGGAKIDDAQVADVLDLIDRRLLLAIAEACVDGDAAAALEACHRAAESGVEPKRLGANLIQLLRDLVVLRVAPDRPQLVEGSDEETAELLALAERCDAARLRRMFRALVKEQEDLAWAPQPGAVLEMAVVRLATLPSGDDVAALLTRLDALERRLSGGGGGPSGGGPGAGSRNATGGAGARGSAGGDGRRASAASAAPRAEPQAAPRNGAAGAESARSSEAAQPTAAPAAERTPEPAPAPAPRASAPALAPPEGVPLDTVFDRLRAFASRQTPGLCAALESAKLVLRTEERLRFSARRAFAADRLEERRAELGELCAQFFQRPLQIEIESAESADAAAAADATVSTLDVVKQLRQQALNHPGITAAIDVFEGEILEIRPLEAPPVSAPDLGELMAKAREVQTRLAQVQQELAARKVEGSAGGGMVTAVATGALRILEIRIEPSLLEGGDRDMLQDLTAAAVNAALANAQRMVQEELQKASGGLSLPFGGPPDSGGAGTGGGAAG